MSRGSVSVSSMPEGYKISGLDMSGDPAYFGYVGSDGRWYIMELNQGSGTAKYAQGALDYATSWAGRVGLSYDYYNNVF